MKQRWDGSLQSANTPTYQQPGVPREDYAIYRCMVTKVFYVDDPGNITKNARNPCVLYEVVILGGAAMGQTLFPCRLAPSLGGNNNYEDYTLQATTKDISKVKLSDHDGDVVYVQFNQGHDAYPVILAGDKGINDVFSGTTASQGPRHIRQYNGVYQEINNQGEFTLKRKGGTLNNGSFNPSNGIEGILQFLKDSVRLGDDSSSLTLTKSIDDALLKTKGGAEFHAKGDKISLGAQGIELLDQIVQFLDKLTSFLRNTDATHDHLGNLGYPTSPPETAADFITAATDIDAIKAKIAQIKGTL